MSAVLARIRAKITRAKQHIQDFQLGLKAFYESKPYEVATKENTETRQRIAYLVKADPVPDSLGAIAADIVQNLRSPLDQIVCQLMIVGGADKATLKHAEYPIRDLAAHYPSARRRIAKHLPQAAIDAIDATEPYKGGKGHAIWQLNALSNPDKHHLTLAAAAFYRGVDISDMMTKQMITISGFSDIKIPPIIIRPADKLVGLKVGDELWGEPLEPKMNHETRFAFDVTIHEPGVIDGEPALKTLQDMSNFVDDIVTQLGRLLP